MPIASVAARKSRDDSLVTLGRKLEKQAADHHVYEGKIETIARRHSPGELWPDR